MMKRPRTRWLGLWAAAFAAMALTACGGDGSPESVCQGLCEWDVDCFGDDEQSCVEQCVQAVDEEIVSSSCISAFESYVDCARTAPNWCDNDQVRALCAEEAEAALDAC